MVLQITFKTPDALEFALDQIKSSCDEEELEETKTFLETFIQYGEYVVIEVDTDTKTVNVVPV